jgi:phage regulator Rha-like protein
MDKFKLYLQYQKEATQAKLRVIERFQELEQRQAKKRTANIDIVKNVLDSAKRPLHVSEIIQMAEKDYQVRLNRDSIVSALLKKIKAGQTFIRTAPNTFALQTSG